MERWQYELILDGISYRQEQLEQDRIKILEAMEPVDVVRPAVPVKVKLPKTPKRKKRNLSPEARERIASAQRRRWAAFRKVE